MAIVENLPVARHFGLHGRLVFGAVEAEGAAAKRRVDKGAMMRRLWLLVHIWPEIFAGDAKTLRRNGLPHLQVANELDQRFQQANLLGFSQVGQTAAVCEEGSGRGPGPAFGTALTTTARASSGSAWRETRPLRSSAITESVMLGWLKSLTQKGIALALVA